MDVQWGVWKVVPRVEVCVQIGDWSGPLLAQGFLNFLASNIVH
jgi:hypothetical protein